MKKTAHLSSIELADVHTWDVARSERESTARDGALVLQFSSAHGSAKTAPQPVRRRMYWPDSLSVSLAAKGDTICEMLRIQVFEVSEARAAMDQVIPSGVGSAFEAHHLQADAACERRTLDRRSSAGPE
eukprot:scaffold1130_cov195-Pinguiococcus_pyrenoidosus.AAC.38